MSDCRKCAMFEECLVDEDCGLFKPKPQTNADRIRAKTDEGLAKLMEKYGCCPPLACPHNEVGVYVTPQDCEMCWLEWLKSPAEEEHNG